MKLTKPLIKSILDTLPISYYLGHGYLVELSDLAKLSSTDLIEQKITLSVEQLLKYDFEYENLDEAEEYVRCMLYHELSHALLTPISKKVIIDQHIFDIFEDERIETLLEYFYLGVDFKKNLSRIEGEDTAFYKAVRLRQCSQEINQKINDLISKYAKMHYTPSPQYTLEYQKDIQELYEQIEAESKEELSEAEEYTMETPGSEHTLSSNSNKLSEEICDSAFAEAYAQLQVYNNPTFRNNIERIIQQRHMLRLNSASGHKGHSGRIEAKLIIKPEHEYKWFNKNTTGDLENGSKFKLNLFVDNSGSAKENENIINSLIHEIVLTERKLPNFVFNLVTINNLAKLRTKGDYTVLCEGGNCLTSDLKTVYRKLQTPDSQVSNIILFHGYAITDDANDHGVKLPAGSLSQAKNFAAFNHPNCLIISDYTNEKILREYCKKAKVIITSDYFNELENCILKFLAQSLK